MNKHKKLDIQRFTDKLLDQVERFDHFVQNNDDFYDQNGNLLRLFYADWFEQFLTWGYDED